MVHTKLLILFLSFISLVGHTQPFASLDVDYSMDIEASADYNEYTPKSARVDAVIESRASSRSYSGDSLELLEDDFFMSHEPYLDRMMSASNASDGNFTGPSFYHYLNSYLKELKSDYGQEQFYFESYYHPEVQFLTGCNMGRAGMPILEKIMIEDGRVMANLICRTEHAEIYFTVDGSQPSKSSQRFTEVFEVPDAVTVRAIAIRDDLELSPVLAFDQNNLTKEEVLEQLDEDKIMGIYPIPDSEEVLVKYKTKAPGEIAITLIDMNRTAIHIDFVNTTQAQMGRCHIDASRVPVGSYLIKFKFDSGKTTYRQVVKE